MRPRAMANMLIRYLHNLEQYYTSTNSHSTNLASPTCTLTASFQKNLCGAQDKSVKISIRLASFKSTCIGQGDTIPLGHLFIGTNRKIMTRLFPSTTHREHAFFIFTAESPKSHMCVWTLRDFCVQDLFLQGINYDCCHELLLECVSPWGKSSLFSGHIFLNWL